MNTNEEYKEQLLELQHNMERELNFLIDNAETMYKKLKDAEKHKQIWITESFKDDMDNFLRHVDEVKEWYTAICDTEDAYAKY